MTKIARLNFLKATLYQFGAAYALIGGKYSFNRARQIPSTVRRNMGGWSDTWSDILSGGNPRWKITDEQSHKKALSHFEKFAGGDPSERSVLCPLAGDDPFVHLLWSRGYSVTTIDLVPAAVEAMKCQFQSSVEDDWTKEEIGTTVTWNHVSGRATLIVGDALEHRSDLVGKFDCVYDKDSFGAIGKEMRKGFCNRIAEYTKSGGILYLECKLKQNHDEVVDIGPPFSLKKENIMEETCYGASFDYVEGLGPVYELPDMPFQQTGHILKRK
uniref:Methyltransferase type 11 domain-containing protein n=1 Tax=Corethron hystrix TaxID=216773 RepID=A0A7S1G2L2_9STRA|mmetsp:Transcript_6751/g.14538  ORF Transcript_6751/g.14538 Transcript_6751/m.14538 type:complete len:271 (+) Transcript_6751:96-908(+)